MENSPDEALSSTPQSQRARLFARVVATAGYVGFIPFAPGTWGSLIGVLLYWLVLRHTSPFATTLFYFESVTMVVPMLLWVAELTLIVSAFGVWAAEKVSLECGVKDPQFVIVDEVSGQLLTYLLALGPVSWKYLLLGFILFRVFDIWKPFPARQAESLPGGWGIMADDWIAGVYAAIGLWGARALGL
jgi:phosphatidylglycerophosphatase A